MELEEPPRPNRVEVRALEPMSIEELEGYIRGLEAEIARARSAIAAKQAQRSSAESFFRLPDRET